MNEYLNMWKNYANFSARTTVRGYWMAVLFNFIAGIVMGIISSMGLEFISYLYSLAIFIPGIALSVRRLRDAGKNWTYMFINLIPVVGIILFIITLCKPSIPDNGIPVV